MSDRPILFSGPMVAAMLEGRKTQTRRVLKPQPNVLNGGQPLNNGRGSYSCEFGWTRMPYTTGDRLWVREAWKCEERFHAVAPRDLKPGVPVYYSADPDPRDSDPGCAGRHRAGMHMPRWASRLTLIVTEVRVQRLQDISEADAQAEGVEWQEPTNEDREWAKRYAEENGGDPSIDGVWIAPGTRQGYGRTKEDRAQPQWGPTAAFAFRYLWDSLNASRGFGWGTNPWVCALTFTVHPQNIDQMETAQ